MGAIGWWPVGLAAAGCVVLAGLEFALARTFAAVPARVYVADVVFPVAWTLAGLFAWKLRPVSRSGPLMVVLGLVLLGNTSYGWQLPTDLPLRSALTFLGAAGFWFGLALTGHLLLTY